MKAGDQGLKQAKYFYTSHCAGLLGPISYNNQPAQVVCLLLLFLPIICLPVVLHLVACLMYSCCVGCISVGHFCGQPGYYGSVGVFEKSEKILLRG